MNEIWKHFKGYYEARQKVLNQSLDENLQLIDDLFGRDNLKYSAMEKEVKDEALRQLEIEWRDKRDTRAEFYVQMAKYYQGIG